MPELPEVERGRCEAERVALDRHIVKAKCAADSIVYDGVSTGHFERALRGQRVNAVCRWGKQLWFELDAPPHPLFHFGMTGGFRTADGVALKLKSAPNVDEWPPRFAKLHLTFDDGGELVFSDGRRLGRILLRDDPKNESPIARLGFDPMHNMLSQAKFRQLIRARSSVIKSLLLDQHVVAGIGNWIADEVLYQARIDPRRRANELEDEEVERLRRCIRSVIRKAVAANADDARYPKTWLFHQRWGRKGGATTSRGEPINHITLGGRTTAWVPSVQV